MRDRLIELLDKKINFVEIANSDKVWTTEKITELADYLLSEGVIVPPCKVGQTVYIISWYYDIEAFIVRDLHYLTDNTDYCVYRFRAVMNRDSDISFTDRDIGKTVFLTREEAEKALNERSENGT